MKLAYMVLVASGVPSLPSRERGLKLTRPNGGLLIALVASFTGAWIETRSVINRQSIVMVASFTGAWIETHDIKIGDGRFIVASFTGAWIETVSLSVCYRGNPGRFLHGSVD